MYYMMRHQLFWDGNKRIAMMAGCGMLNINENQLETWHTLLSAFYESNDDNKIVAWTYENCLYGMTV